MSAPLIITSELFVFLGCGIVLGLCKFSLKFMLIWSGVIFVKGILWDAYFIGMIHPLSITVCIWSVMFFLAGWAVIKKRPFI